MAANDDITLGELGRRLERFATDVQVSIDRMVVKEVYDRDMKELNRRLQDHDDSIEALSTNRRQVIIASLTVFGAVIAALCGALISYGLHP